MINISFSSFILFTAPVCYMRHSSECSAQFMTDYTVISSIVIAH